MKKLLLLTLSIVSTQILSMEKEQQFPWTELLPELKAEVINSSNAQSAIDVFKKLRETSKQYNTQQAITTFLDTLNAKYPGQEVRIARALNNQYAKEWLNKKKPGVPYNPTSAYTYIPGGQHPIDNLIGEIHLLKSQKAADNLITQLGKGLDPNSLFSSQTFHFLLENPFSLPVIKAFVSYGLNLRGRFYRWDAKQQRLIRDENLSLLTYAQGKIRDYLIQEGAE